VLLRIPRLPLKGIAILFVLAAGLTVGLLAIQGRLFPKKPAVNEIAFVSDRDGRTDLWLIGVDGSNPHPVTSDESPESAPSWSRNATKLVYTAERAGIPQIFTVDAVGGRKPEQLTVSSGVKLQPLFSPNGERIAYIAQGKVYAMNSDGSNIDPVLPTEEASALVMSGGAYTDIDWSSDSKSLAAVQKVEDVEVPQMLSDPWQRTETVSDLQGRPLTGQKVFVKWSPTGRKLAVSTSAHDTGILMVIDYADQTVTQAARGIIPGRAAWSPAGDTIAFQILQHSEGQGYTSKALGVVNIDSLEQKIVAKGDISGPSWSSDGKLIVFTRTDKDGTRAIWSVKPDGTGARNLTAGKGDSYDASASPNPGGAKNASS
jgi:Tol biopolymer transport system component